MELAAELLHRRFEMVAGQQPDAVAIAAESGELSYRQLNAAADRWAARLVELGVGPRCPVVVSLPRSPALVTAVLAVLKAGGHYVLLEPAEQPARRQLILDQLPASALVLDRPLPTTGTGPLPPSLRPPAESPLACLRFQHGPAGGLIGVELSHRSLLQLAADCRWREPGFGRTLLVSPYHSAAFGFELWMPLLFGHTVVLHPPGRPDTASLRAVIADHRVSACYLPAELVRTLSIQAPGTLRALSRLITGWDTITPTIIAQLGTVCPRLQVLGMAGGDEVATFSSCAELTAPGVGSRPVAGSWAYLLDGQLRPAAEGELYLAGAGLARGYYRQPALTADRFVPDPFGGSGQRMVRTGRLARWTADGRLELLGKLADQLWIRGFRVAPAAVESVLCSHREVAAAAVTSRDLGPLGQQLVGFLVARSRALDVAELRRYAAARLPDYLVPAVFGLLPALPLAADGKPDRLALQPAPARTGQPGRGIA